MFTNELLCVYFFPFFPLLFFDNPRSVSAHALETLCTVNFTFFFFCQGVWHEMFVFLNYSFQKERICFSLHHFPANCLNTVFEITTQNSDWYNRGSFFKNINFCFILSYPDVRSKKMCTDRDAKKLGAFWDKYFALLMPISSLCKHRADFGKDPAMRRMFIFRVIVIVTHHPSRMSALKKKKSSFFKIVLGALFTRELLYVKINLFFVFSFIRMALALYSGSVGGVPFFLKVFTKKRGDDAGR